jgi:hypothetical protein
LFSFLFFYSPDDQPAAIQKAGSTVDIRGFFTAETQTDTGSRATNGDVQSRGVEREGLAESAVQVRRVPWKWGHKERKGKKKRKEEGGENGKDRKSWMKVEQKEEVVVSK